MSTTPVIGTGGAANATPKRASQRVQSDGTPQKVRKHRNPDDYAASQAHLEASLVSAKKALAAVKASKKKGAAVNRRLMQKSSKWDVNTLVNVIEIRQDLPDIVCPHCQASQPVGTAVRTAYRDFKAKKRALNLNQPGKKLAVQAGTAPSTVSSASTSIAAKT